jgi:hypothetical protein
MSLHIRRVPAALFAVGLVVAIAACGDDDDGGDTSGGDPSGSDGADFCDEFREVAEGLTSFDDIEDPSDFAGVYQELSASIGDIDPPEEIADDWGRLDEAVAQVAAALEGATDEQIQSGEAFTAIEEEFSDFDEVGARIDAFTEEECGFTIDSVNEEETEEEPAG